MIRGLKIRDTRFSGPTFYQKYVSPYSAFRIEISKFRFRKQEKMFNFLKKQITIEELL